MAAINWLIKKENALSLLHKLLDIWQSRRPLSEIRITGPQTNNAVLALDFETSLPLPYDDNMGFIGEIPPLADLFAARKRDQQPDDEIAENFKNWIRFIESNALGDNPARDPSLITLVDGSGFYDIPQSTLCKYAKNKLGEAYYLWSLRHRGNRYFKKEDLERLRQSREKLKRK